MALNDIMGGGQYDAYNQGVQQSQQQLSDLLKNQRTQAEMPGIVGQSQSQAAAGKIAEAGVPGQISEQASKVRTALSSNEVTQMNNTGQLFNQFASTLDVMPPESRGKAIGLLADKIGIPEDHPLRDALSKLSPEDAPDKLRDMGLKIQKGAQAMVQQAQSIMGRQTVAETQAASRVNVADIKADSAALISGMNNTSREKIAANALELKRILQAEKVPNTDQLVAKRAMEYQAEPTQERKDALDQAYALKAGLENNKALAQAFQGANTGAKVLGDELAPNTIPKPNLNPTATLPTGGAGLAPPAGAPVRTAPAATVAPQPTKVGMQNGRPVYTSDPAHPQDQSKWHY